MPTIPAPTFDSNREEWPDADFDFPEGQPLHAISDKDDDEDWDLEMDLGKTGSAKIQVPSRPIVSDLVPSSMTQMVTIRPPQPSLQLSEEDEEDDEGVSTIKAATIMPKPPQPKLHQDPIDEDFEDGFSLPSDLTRLSLAPLSLNHRSSKNSLEWGDKDQTSSSQSSDAYSSLGFADASPSSNSTSSASLPDTETEDEDEDFDLVEGLVIPSEIFESGHGGRKLNKILEQKKMTLFVNEQLKVTSPDPEDDFEMGLVIDDDVDLSPSRLLTSAQKGEHSKRSSSLPTTRPSLRPPSRLKSDRAKSPVNPPPSSTRQFQKLRLSPSPPLNPPTRSQTFQALSQTPSPSTSSFLAPKPGSLRGQKSHSGLKPPTPPPTRKLTRKASLSSLMDKSQPQASGSGSSSKARYEEPTAASRAKTQRSSTTRYKVPPTRPSTPSSNTAALRLTMPTVPNRARPALSSVWGAPSSPAIPSPILRNTSSPLPRPPSSLSLKASRTVLASPPPPKVLRKPRRARTYGDGTELDNIDDLPTDRDKESRFRVQPKGYGNRIPGGTYSATKPPEKGTIRKKRREPSGTNADVLGTSSITNRKSSRADLSSLKSAFGSPPKKKKTASPSSAPKKKPTLIRNLGGTGGPKVVGEMKWNPHTLRWEGNEQALREFDAVVTSTRPALITHLTGSSIGSPVGSFASGARIVGNMIFDPQRMCWISTLPPEEDEPDVFANLADDEEDGEGWSRKGDTIRGSLKSLTPSETSRTSTSMSGLTDPPSPARSRTRSPSESDGESDRGSRASLFFDIDSTFVQSCRAAEQRHDTELSGWKKILARHDRTELYEIRALATRNY
ncbi:hypothetical protein PQX77_008203 [Marasmius sp. AFHP31]|nr:hypothetical protein PQX77_008262 [Marasmius sp. AFHP31]KAK1228709.1 hypothetical protein PQX77_008203 [Marasmius sp. AFHP31]